jgi:hypothetical protein
MHNISDAEMEMKRKIFVKKGHISDKDDLDDDYWASQSVYERLNELQRLRLFIGKLNDEFAIKTFQKKVVKKLIFEQDV